MMQDNNTAFKVGLVTVIMVASISGLLVWKSGIFLKATGYKVTGKFDNVSGLLVGAEVRYRGYKVGKVFEVVPTEKEVLVHFWVQNGIRIPHDSVARVVFDGLVGEKFVAIKPLNVSENAIIQPGDSIPGYASAGLADAIEVGVKNLDHTEAILKNFRSILTSQEITQSIRNSIMAFETTAENFSRLTQQLSNQGLLTNLGQTMKRLDTLTNTLQQVVQTVQTNVVNQKNAQDISTIIQNLTIFSEQLRKLSDANPTDGGKTPMSLVRVATQLKVKPQFDLQYEPAVNRTSYKGQIDLKAGHQFIRAGFGDQQGVGQLSALQYGLSVTHHVDARVGAFYTKPGAALDYNLTPDTQFTVECYDPNQVQVELIGKTKLAPQWDGFIKLRSDETKPNTQLNQLGIGVSFFP